MITSIFCLCNIFILVSTNTLQHIPYRVLLGLPQGSSASQAVSPPCRNSELVNTNYGTQCSRNPEILNSILNHPTIQSLANKQCDKSMTEAEGSKVVNNYFIVSPDLLSNNKNQKGCATNMVKKTNYGSDNVQNVKRQIDKENAKSCSENKHLETSCIRKNTNSDVRINGNPTDEMIIRNIHSRFPQISEDSLRKVLLNMKRNIRHSYFDPYTQIPDTFNHHWGCPYNKICNSANKRTVVNANGRKSKIVSSSRVAPKHHSKKPKGNNSSTTSRKTLKSKNDTKNGTALSRNKTSHRNKSVNRSNVKDIKSKEKENDEDTKISKSNTRNKLTKESPESEGELPEMSDNDIDEYYPDFRQNDSLAKKKFYGSYAEYDDEEIQRAERKVKHSNESTDAEVTEKIIFKSPPGLETPDFKTVKVNNKNNVHNGNRRPIFTSDWDNSDSKDSDSKKSLESSNNSESSSSVEKNIEKNDIETVFAKSRVVNYGNVQNDNDNEDSNTTSSESEDVHDTTEQDKRDEVEASVVMAKPYKY